MKVIHDEFRYELLRVIAEGGMGVVYEARQHGAGGFTKRVAIKVIREEFSRIPEFQGNFIGEARLVADLIHTNIVQIYHLGVHAGRYSMTMEYVRGVNVEQFIDRHRTLGRPVPVALAAFIVSRICRGLMYAHGKKDDRGRLLNIVHRDVSPKNILLAFEGDVKLTDFGIAKALDLMYNGEGEVIPGRDEYLSPEQAGYQVTDSRADLFSAGIVLSELLLGRNIFKSADRLQSRRNILAMPIPRFSQLRHDIDEKLEIILARALARERQRRFQSAEEMMTALEVFLYSDGYGPTNEKLGVHLKEIFPESLRDSDDSPFLGTPRPLTMPGIHSSSSF